MTAIDTDEALKLDNQVCFALTVATRAVVGIYRPLLEPMGITHPQYLVLLTLWESSPRSMRELGEVLEQEAAALSPLLKRLEQAGLITRSRNVDDERHLDIDLTEKGRALRADATRIPPAVVDKLGMSLAELDRLRTALWKVIEASR